MTITNTLADDVKSALRNTAESVHVVALRNNEDEFFAMTATAVTVVSLDPPSLLVCINEKTSFYEQIQKTDYFSINTLKANQQSLSNACAGGASNEERESAADWSSNQKAPMLADAQSSYLCEVRQTIKHGSHLIVIGEALEVTSADEPIPLVYLNGQYASVPTPMS